MRLDDRLHDREPQPGAPDGRGRRRAEEALEQLLDLVLGDADARVGDLEHRVVPLPIQAHRHGPSLRRELDRVGEEVAQHLDETLAVGGERARLIGLLEPHPDALSFRGGAGRLDLAHDELDQVDLRRVEREPFGVHLRDLEDVVHEGVQPVGVAVDDVEEPRLHLVELAGLALPHELEVADNGRQRRAQLVGHRADELVLQAVDLLESLVLLRERACRGPFAVEQLLALERERELGRDRAQDVPASGQPLRVDVGHEVRDDLSAHGDRCGERVRLLVDLAMRDDVRSALPADERLRGPLGVCVELGATGRREQLAREAADDRFLRRRPSRSRRQVGEAHDHQRPEQERCRGGHGEVPRLALHRLDDDDDGGHERERGEEQHPLDGRLRRRRRRLLGQLDHGLMEPREPENRDGDHEERVREARQPEVADFVEREEEVAEKRHADGQEEQLERTDVAPAAAEREADGDRTQQHVRHRVGGRDEAVERALLRAPGLGDVHPAHRGRAHRDDPRVDQHADVPARRAPADADDEPRGHERVAREVEEVGRGRERVVARQRVAEPQCVADAPGQDPTGDQPPRVGGRRPVAVDAEHDERDGAEVGDERDAVADGRRHRSQHVQGGERGHADGDRAPTPLPVRVFAWRRTRRRGRHGRHGDIVRPA